MSFSAQVMKFGPAAYARINRVRHGVTIKLFSAVIKDTPVDEGRLRANWQLTEGSPAQGTLDDTAKNKQGLNVEEAKRVEATSGDMPVFLTNNLPYAGKIEYEGWSHTKAPEGMVRRNVARFAGLVKEVLIQKTK